MGYAGGTKKNPTYHSLGDHSETIQIDFDPTRILYKELVQIFWESHDPIIQTWSRQYMAVIFYHNDDQRRIALETKDREEARLQCKVLTGIMPLTEFYLAEDYHQKHALQHNHELFREFKSIYPNFHDIVYSTAAARVNGYLGGYGTYKTLQAELDSYGLSPEAGKKLLNIAKETNRLQCKRSGPC